MLLLISGLLKMEKILDIYVEFGVYFGFKFNATKSTWLVSDEQFNLHVRVTGHEHAIWKNSVENY